MREVGAHVSAAGGIELALERAAAIGGNCVQVFSGSPRVWARPDLAKFDPVKIAAKRKEKSIGSIITHSLYLVNLAADNPELIRKSLAALAFDLQFDAHLQGQGVVVHLGSHKGAGWEAAKQQVLMHLRQLVTTAPAGATFLIENAAGHNGKIGGDLAQIAWLISEVGTSNLGWCFDTCHAHAAGYGLGSSQPATATGSGATLMPQTAAEAIDQLNLWSTLRCVHVNDSRDPFGSGRDRHQNLGDGEISSTDLRYFLNLPQIKPLPLILEVPGIDQQGPDVENVQRLRALLEE